MAEHCQHVVMTPSLAKTILNASPKIARTVSAHHVVAMVARMRKPDSASYAVDLDVDGRLSAGRHVLLAVIETDANVPVMLTTGTTPSPFVSYAPFDARAAAEGTR